MAENEKLNYLMKIKIINNGPYIVTGGIPLAEGSYISDDQGLSTGYSTDQELPLLEEYYLCRCGKSKNKPFCDRTHRQIPFDGAETASREPYSSQVECTEGAQMDLTDVQSLCASARFCDRAGGVWDNIRKLDDPEAWQIAIDEVWNCPAGRLALSDKEGHPIEPELVPSILVVDDPLLDVVGPLWVRGGIPIESGDGETYEVRNRVTLCRCGKSCNKPFCDGSHQEA
jgi:CDGSH-type Zn-finger protein